MYMYIYNIHSNWGGRNSFQDHSYFLRADGSNKRVKVRAHHRTHYWSIKDKNADTWLSATSAMQLTDNPSKIQAICSYWHWLSLSTHKTPGSREMRRLSNWRESEHLASTYFSWQHSFKCPERASFGPFLSQFFGLIVTEPLPPRRITSTAQRMAKRKWNQVTMLKCMICVSTSTDQNIPKQDFGPQTIRLWPTLATLPGSIIAERDWNSFCWSTCLFYWVKPQVSEELSWGKCQSRKLPCFICHFYGLHPAYLSEHFTFQVVRNKTHGWIPNWICSTFPINPVCCSNPADAFNNPPTTLVIGNPCDRIILGILSLDTCWSK